LPTSPDEAAALLILDGATGNPTWKRAFLETAKRDWIDIFSGVLAVPVGTFVTSVLSDGSRLANRPIAAALIALLSLRPNPADPGVVSFADYLALMLRFGPICRLRRSLELLTVNGLRGEFQTWFRPSLSHDEANRNVKEARVGTWVVRLSWIHNEFALHWHATESFPPLVCRIRYDGLALDGKFYSAVTENEDPQFAGSWTELLVDLLGLSTEDAFRFPHEQLPRP
jgi:hypothetical protein